MTHTDALAAYLAGLTLTGGDHDGERLTVLPWERRFVRGAFRGPGDAALSVARGNGKSAVVAGLAAAVVDPVGPLHGRRGEVVVVASSFGQARIIFEDVREFLLSAGYDLEDRRRWIKRDSQNAATLEHKASGARVRCIGSDPSRAHGLRPSLLLLDEPAQWPSGTADRMLAALRTSLGKVPGSKLIALGTRPGDELHWFARLLKSAPYGQVHAAAETDPPFRVRTWRKANPSLDHLPSLRAQLAVEAADARTDPDALASFRALRLNLGTADTAQNVLIAAEAWTDAEALTAAPDGGYVLGIDLGTNAAMSAAAAYWRSGRLDCFAVFPETPSLAARGLADGVGGLYQRIAERGELVQLGARVSDPVAMLREALRRWGDPAAVVCDTWREAELRQSLEASGVPWCPVVVRRQGFYDGGEDVRCFRRAVLSGVVAPAARSLLLRSALREARTVSDPAGNHKLAKGSEGGRRVRARDDAAAAAVLAVAAGWREWHQRSGDGQRLVVGSVG